MDSSFCQAGWNAELEDREVGVCWNVARRVWSWFSLCAYLGSGGSGLQRINATFNFKNRIKYNTQHIDINFKYLTFSFPPSKSSLFSLSFIFSSPKYAGST
ncbi:unnamed protein product [Cyclocybe aegerita]|uniref:Uncharacterized protein n=1 Tax=Cyclocybe aegerita TaxID=1973307 RepID=A0A8S0W2T5_CYCAE|nr:unnamed protein product [Cyclocybe aegerita]